MIGIENNMNESVSVFLAFSAGLMSFFSPCVLPIIPSWLCVIGGVPSLTKSNDETENIGRPKPIARTISFVFGFSAVFITLSILFTGTLLLFSGISRYINLVAGIIIIILGLNIIFDFIRFLNFEKRFRLKNNPKGIIGTFVLGCAFGAGWTPCVGTQLAAILALAGQNGGIPQAVFYLVCFSLGLGLPFIFAAVFFDIFLKFSIKIRKYLPLIQRVCGIMLIIIGILIITGIYQSFSGFMAALANPG